MASLIEGEATLSPTPGVVGIAGGAAKMDGGARGADQGLIEVLITDQYTAAAMVRGKNKE